MAERLKKGYLQWRCRRGTKELDVVLNRFLDGQYNQLNDQELVDFDALLDTQDTVLWYWLSGQTEADSDVLQSLINKINA
jgi:antitoxin CptB